MIIPDDTIRKQVEEYYGQILGGSEDLKTNACCAVGAPPQWLARLLENIHDDVAARFYGCGFPIPEALEGCRMLDLGCGTGRDVYIASQLVGPTGHVFGVDMTPSQLEVANDTLDYHTDRFGYPEPNVSFHEGYIEDLSPFPIDDESLDVIISNCVINLSPCKDLVLAEAYRLLATGGELYFSDVLADRRLPSEMAEDPLLYGECLGGAMYFHDFLELPRPTGFRDPRVDSRAPITIENDELAARIGAARFESVTFRLFKLDDLDAQCEDYGQVATYRGTIPHNEALFTLDDHHLFETGRPERVCGNTAAMLEDTRFGEHFDITGDKSVHYGIFDCAATMAADQYGSNDAVASSSDGGCC